MSFRFYDSLDDFLRQIDVWRSDSMVSKHDVLDSTRQRVLLFMTQVVSTPLIGTAYAYPGDIQHLRDWVDST